MVYPHGDEYIEIANLTRGQVFEHLDGQRDRVARIDAARGTVYCESGRELSFDDGYVKGLVEEPL